MATTSSSRRPSATASLRGRHRASRIAGALLVSATLVATAACGNNAAPAPLGPNDGDGSASPAVPGTPPASNASDAAAALVLPRSATPTPTPAPAEPVEPADPATVTITVTPRETPPPAGQSDKVPEDNRVLTQVDVSDQEPYWFRTPSKNIVCMMYAPGEPGDATARCTIVAKEWRAPDKPADCPLAWGDDLEVDTDGRPGFVCAGDTVLGASTTVEYGTRLLMKPGLTCSVTTEGVTCANRTSGRGFFLSRERYRIF